MSPQDRAIQAFLANPSAETLPPLLHAVGDSVYNLCFQILRRREDAEDAAQEVLVEIARDGSQIREGRTFRRWLYKVCLNTSLDHLRARRRRVEAESSKTTCAPPPPVNGDALFEALAKLGDGDRTLLVEHYFEGVSLTDMAAREGCSKVAVWKRIEKARSRLKRTLGAIGLGLAALLLAIPAAAAPSRLVPRSMDKALLALGGLTVTTKSGLSVAAAVIAILVLGFGVAGLAAFRKSEVSGKRLAPVPVVASNEIAEQKSLEAIEDSPEPTVEADFSKVAKEQELRARLTRFRAFRLKLNEEFKDSFKDQGGWLVLPTWELQKRWKKAHMDELQGVRDLIKEAPGPFLEFVFDPANEECLIDLLTFTVANTRLSGGVEIVANSGMRYSDAPPGLLDGLHERLLTAGTQVKLSLLTFFNALRDDNGMINGLPEKYLDHYRHLLATGEPAVRAITSIVLCNDPRIRSEDLTSIQGLIGKPEFNSWDSRLIEALRSAQSPEVEDWFLGQIEGHPDDRFRGQLVEAMARRAEFDQTTPANLKRLANSIETMATRPQDVWNQWYILGATVHLEEKSMIAILERLSINPAKKIIKRTIDDLIAKIRSGEYDRKTLQELVFKGRGDPYWSQPGSE